MNLISSLSLVSETTLQRQELRKVKTILNLLTEHADTAQFREPVDWQSLGLLDYPTVIKKPMDLGTVNEKIRRQEYNWVQEVLDDVQMIWDNCKLYNQVGSWIYTTADKMEKYYKKLIKNYFTGIPIATTRAIPVQKSQVSGNNNKNVRQRRGEVREGRSQYGEESSSRSKDNRRDVVRKLKDLSAEQLGEVVELIMESQPEALNRKEEQFQVYISKIDEGLWGEIREKLNQWEEKESEQIYPAKKVKL